MHSAAFCPMRRSACARPTDVVVFPSPAAVGLIAVTSTSRPARWALRDLERDLRLVLPVQVEVVGAEAELGGDVDDWPQLRVLRDLDVGRNVATKQILRACGDCG